MVSFNVKGKSATMESCDIHDNDCDGRVDEDVRNACGYCGDDITDVCNGEDEDCDGKVDENAACPEGLFCAHGGCAEPCQQNECVGELECIDGFCIPKCTLAPAKTDKSARPMGVSIYAPIRTAPMIKSATRANVLLTIVQPEDAKTDFIAKKANASRIHVQG